MGRTRKSILCCLVPLTIIASGNTAARDQEFVDFGDTMQWLLPLSAYVGTTIARDKEGAYNIKSNMALIAEGNWISTSDDEHLDASLMFNYLFDRHWDAGVGYGEYKRQTDTPDLFNSVKYNVVLLNVGYTF